MTKQILFTNPPKPPGEFIKAARFRFRRYVATTEGVFVLDRDTWTKIDATSIPAGLLV